MGLRRENQAHASVHGKAIRGTSKVCLRCKESVFETCDSLMKSANPQILLMFSGKRYRFFAEIRRGTSGIALRASGGCRLQFSDGNAPS